MKYVLKAKYIKDYKIWLSFNDKKEGEIDLKNRLLQKDGVFEPLKDITYFKNFKVTNDTISWENGADFAPEFLYELMLEQNK